MKKVDGQRSNSDKQSVIKVSPRIYERIEKVYAGAKGYWKVNSEKWELIDGDNPFKDYEVVETIVYYDGPLITWIKIEDKHYYYAWVDDIETKSVDVAIEATEEQMKLCSADLDKGLAELTENEPDVFIIYLFNDGTSLCYRCKYQDFPDEYKSAYMKGCKWYNENNS
jgi:hypothetical protein